MSWVSCPPPVSHGDGDSRTDEKRFCWEEVKGDTVGFASLQRRVAQRVVTSAQLRSTHAMGGRETPEMPNDGWQRFNAQDGTSRGRRHGRQETAGNEKWKEQGRNEEEIHPPGAAPLVVQRSHRKPSVRPALFRCLSPSHCSTCNVLARLTIEMLLPDSWGAPLDGRPFFFN